jgi:hypothetical protein
MHVWCPSGRLWKSPLHHEISVTVIGGGEAAPSMTMVHPSSPHTTHSTLLKPDANPSSLTQDWQPGSHLPMPNSTPTMQVGIGRGNIDRHLPTMPWPPSSITTTEFWYSIPTIIILIGIQSGHNYCRNTVGLWSHLALMQSEYIRSHLLKAYARQCANSVHSPPQI